MKKILLIGKTDSAYTELGDKLSMHYTVRYGSSGGFAAEALLNSFAPSLIVIKAADSDIGITKLVGEKYGSIPVIVLGNHEQAAAMPWIRPAAVCDNSVQTVFDAVCSAMPYADESGGTLTVMVIDDDVAILRMMKTFLGDEFDMVLATSGSKALTLLEKKRPDVILLDYEMPEMNGLQTLEAIRGKAGYSDIPVVFMTGANTPEVLDSINAAKTAGYLMKPADAPDIKTAVRKAAMKQ
ncbi:MAG: response regulator [Oscillospiraceae bacterium]|nr:response regulator [Oscillospiraceae bacterium]